MQKTFSLGLFVFVGFLLGSRTRDVHAGTAVRLNVPDMVEHAELVVEGRVLARRALVSTRGRIETEYTLRVDETFRGEPRALRTFRLPGGTLADGRGLGIAGMPELAVGEDTLLFLTREGSSSMRMPVGLAQGKYTVLRDASGRKRLGRKLGELALVDPITRAALPAPAEGVLDYDTVVAEIRSAAARARTTQGGR